MRAAQEQSTVPDGGVAAAHDQQLGIEVVLGTASHRVFGAHEGEVACLLPLENSELIRNVLFERIVPVQMVGPHVEQRRDLKAGTIEIVQLKGGDFEDE